MAGLGFLVFVLPVVLFAAYAIFVPALGAWGAYRGLVAAADFANENYSVGAISAHPELGHIFTGFVIGGIVGLRKL